MVDTATSMWCSWHCERGDADLEKGGGELRVCLRLVDSKSTNRCMRIGKNHLLAGINLMPFGSGSQIVPAFRDLPIGQRRVAIGSQQVAIKK